MPAQCRTVTVAPGHILRCRRTAAQSTRPGHVRVQATRRPPFDVAERLWNEAPVA
ncbi:hypothetical protein SAMN05192583_0599 [Sphingomonas gellani]|uniref:Uncharacterized protein n=1 Tax=Sphingomonas gellani TaxID=1166340 RepID=A0A1H7ZAG5_9SPHN|nr:hypothetical protein SAMN05192583_0599 [Sphingomonas gellani]